MTKRLGIGMVVLWAALGARAAASDKAASAKGPGAGEYAGSEACMACHEDVYKKQFEGTPHFQTMKKDGHGCESCHGPGAEHIAGGGDKSKIIRFGELSRAESSQRCLECHGESQTQRHHAVSAHAGNDVGCVDCHSPHHAKAEQHLLTKSQPELCYGCHAATRADFSRPYRHRVNEGLVQCSDCHNVHGTAGLRQGRATQGGRRPATSVTPTSRGRLSTSTCRSRPRGAPVVTRRTVRATRASCA